MLAVLTAGKIETGRVGTLANYIIKMTALFKLDKMTAPLAGREI